MQKSTMRSSWDAINSRTFYIPPVRSAGFVSTKGGPKDGFEVRLVKGELDPQQWHNSGRGVSHRGKPFTVSVR